MAFHLDEFRRVGHRYLHQALNKRETAVWGRKKKSVPERQVDSRFHRLRLMASGPIVGGPPGRVKVSPTAKLGNVVINTMSGNVEIGDHVFFGQEALLLTGTHDFTATGQARQDRIPDSGRDIIIEDGAWIASRAIIIGPCRIGANAVVSCGCVVDFDVPPNTIVRARQEIMFEPIRFRDRSDLGRSDPDRSDLGRSDLGRSDLGRYA